MVILLSSYKRFLVTHLVYCFIQTLSAYIPNINTLFGTLKHRLTVFIKAISSALGIYKIEGTQTMHITFNDDGVSQTLTMCTLKAQYTDNNNKRRKSKGKTSVVLYF